MSLKLRITAGAKLTAHLKSFSSTVNPQLSHVRVASRGERALGWNKLYASLVVQPGLDGRNGVMTEAWVRKCLVQLGSIDGVHPDSVTIDDVKFLLGHLRDYLPDDPSSQNIALVDPPDISDILDSLGDRDLGDAYSPIDDPGPFYADTYFVQASSAMRERRYLGWWSPVERETLPVGVAGGPGRVEPLGASTQITPTPPLDGSWSDVDIDATHRLTYLGQERLLDWVPAAGSTRYRVWKYDRFAQPQAPILYALVDQQAWSTIDAGHELIWLGRDLQADPQSADDLVLDWAPATGDYRLYRVDLEGTKEDGKTPDILPEPPLARGNWKTIRAGRKLIYLGGNRVLDWESATGNFRVWALNRGARGASGPNNDPLPTEEVQGNWPTIREGHRIINLGGDRVLTWLPETGAYRVWRYDRSVKGTGDPLVSPPVVEGIWHDVDDGHELIWLGGRHVLDWQPGSSAYRIRNHDRTVVSGDPLP
jgi:hypothetical protein